MPLNLRPIIDAILADYALPLDGYHGVAHWARVYENGLRLSKITGANVEVVRLFALFHDSRRVNEGHDPDHGSRGAEFAKELHGKLFAISDEDFNLLHRACVGHTHERTHPDISIQTCWDSDRLDLGRVGITPHPSRLCTEAARNPAMLKWADGRGCSYFVPELVKKEWGVELPLITGRFLVGENFDERTPVDGIFPTNRAFGFPTSQHKTTNFCPLMHIT